MFAELRELLRSGAIRRHQLGAKDLLTSTSYDMSVKRPFDIHIIIYKFSQELKQILGDNLQRLLSTVRMPEAIIVIIPMLIL